MKTLPVSDAVGTVLAHDITEIRTGEFKGCAFRKGHIIQAEDVCRLQRLGKEHLYVLSVSEDELHEDEAAYRLANALMGEGVCMQGSPREGKINIIADRDGLLKINEAALLDFNMLGDIMCATTHDNTVVKKGQLVAGTRAIPLIAKKEVVEQAEHLCKVPGGVINVKALRKPKTGVVITGNEVYYGKIQDAFAPVITKKIDEFGGEIIGTYYAPDDQEHIETRLRELLDAGADLLITTGGMSVDPDDVTRFAIRKLGATDITYGSAVLPGAMFMVAYLNTENETTQNIPILGIPACGMYHKTTVFDLVLPRILAGEHIGRMELAELGHGGLCLNCEVCRYPVCPFGK
ncbi:MAG: molybdopterin-binding protein [Nitrospirae bacterium]|nr:molybdopterin-binding protein [Nitrospirota bacterium]